MKRFAQFLIVLGPLFASGQIPLLERKITLTVHEERLEQCLKKIASAGGFTFSYNPAILNPEKIVSHQFVNSSIRNVLDQLFEGSIQYRSRGKYIILTKADVGSGKKKAATVSGYVVDEATGARIRDVSIYDPVTLISTVTDAEGYFELTVERPSAEMILSVNKRDYADTLVMVEEKGGLLEIPIRVNKEKIIVLADTVGEKIKRLWKKGRPSFHRINRINIGDTLYRETQVSLIPFVGTNHKLSGHVINNYSFNILGGYSLGVKKFELGGVFNLVEGDVNGVQVAGVFNANKGRMNGFQFAGVFNANRDSTSAFQFAGVINLNMISAGIVSAAGVLNINLKATEAVQLAGVGNLAIGEQRGPQIGGVYNISTHDTGPLQLAGVFNISAGDMSGTQVSSVINVTGRKLRGGQVALINYAREVAGAQVGLINISDTIKGIPVGFMSIVWKGYHKIEFSADEVFFNNLAFRTGVRQFYNIFTAGARPSSYGQDETFWSFGYGFGTAPKLSRKLFLNFDVTANQIVEGNVLRAVNILNKLYIGLDYQAFKKLSFTLGATLNGYLTKNSPDARTSLFTDFQPDIFYDRDLGSDHNMKMWLGAKVGVRFL